MAWDHGKAMPAWNSCLLPKEDMQLDIGTAAESADDTRDGHIPPGRKRIKKTAQSELVANTNRLFEAALNWL